MINNPFDDYLKAGRTLEAILDSIITTFVNDNIDKEQARPKININDVRTAFNEIVSKYKDNLKFIEERNAKRKEQEENNKTKESINNPSQQETKTVPANSNNINQENTTQNGQNNPTQSDKKGQPELKRV